MDAAGHAAAIGAMEIKKGALIMFCVALLGFAVGLVCPRRLRAPAPTAAPTAHVVTCRKGGDTLVFKATGNVYQEDACQDFFGHPISSKLNPRCDRPDIHIWSDDSSLNVTHMEFCAVTTEPIPQH